MHRTAATFDTVSNEELEPHGHESGTRKAIKTGIIVQRFTEADTCI